MIHESECYYVEVVYVIVCAREQVLLHAQWLNVETVRSFAVELIDNLLVICPSWLNVPTNRLIPIEDIHILLKFQSLRRPEHGPVGPGHLPRSPTPLKIPPVHRIILPATPTNTIREAIPDHSLENYICDSADSLAALQDCEFVQVWHHLCS